MTFTTTIKALNPQNGILQEYEGPRIEAECWSEAEKYCQENGLGYCQVDGILLAEIDEENINQK